MRQETLLLSKREKEQGKELFYQNGKTVGIKNSQGYLFFFPWIISKQDIKIFEKVMKSLKKKVAAKTIQKPSKSQSQLFQKKVTSNYLLLFCTICRIRYVF